MQVFDGNATIPTYLSQHRKLHNILVPLLTFVVCPIISILLIATNGANLVTTSISKLGWQYGGGVFDGTLNNRLLPLVFAWGVVNLALITYTLKLTLDGGRYSKASKVILYTLLGIGIVLLLVGISVPFINDELHEHYVMRKVHNAFATVGFCMFAVMLIVLSAMTFFRNKLQAMLSSSAMAFLIITGIFAVIMVNSPEKRTFITASAQMYIFTMFHILLCAQYFLNQFLPNEKLPETCDCSVNEDVKAVADVSAAQSENGSNCNIVN